MINGYEKNYLDILPGLKHCDFAECAPRLGLQPADGGAKVRFICRDYLISISGVEPLDGKPANSNNKSVLVHYALSRGAGDPEYSFAPLFRLSGAIAGQKTPGHDIMSDPLLREFASGYTGFARVAKNLGGECVEEGLFKHVWRFMPLPKIPLQVVFYEADEEFPADIQIMFDVTAPRFLEFECLAFLSGCFVNALIQSNRKDHEM